MTGYRVVGACRENVESPMRHQHLVAIAVVDEHSPAGEPAIVWSCADFDREQGAARFTVGPVEAAVVAEITYQPCKLCGDDTLRVLPWEAERSLPECPAAELAAAVSTQSRG